jgi:hypothetical protein
VTQSLLLLLQKLLLLFLLLRGLVVVVLLLLLLLRVQVENMCWPWDQRLTLPTVDHLPVAAAAWCCISPNWPLHLLHRPCLWACTHSNQKTLVLQAGVGTGHHLLLCSPLRAVRDRKLVVLLVRNQGLEEGSAVVGQTSSGVP